MHKRYILQSRFFHICAVLLFTSFITSCEESNYVPKPKGYNFIELPAHEYTRFTEKETPFSFENSIHSKVTKDTTGWYNNKKKSYKIISYPEFNARIHLTYKEITNNKDSLMSFINESYRLAYGHDVKAYGISPEVIRTKNNKPATIIRLEGEVPSHVQFFAHDSSTHFLRGALYFPTATRNDSLNPVIDYIEKDIKHLLNTLDWIYD